MKNSDPTEVKSRPHKADSTTQAPSKIARILAHLLAGGSINRFEAERIGEHCLPSTISVLVSSQGLAFQRQSEKVPNRWGKPCTVTCYSLPECELKRARAVLLAQSKSAEGEQ